MEFLLHRSIYLLYGKSTRLLIIASHAFGMMSSQGLCKTDVVLGAAKAESHISHICHICVMCYVSLSGSLDGFYELDFPRLHIK